MNADEVMKLIHQVDPSGCATAAEYASGMSVVESAIRKLCAENERLKSQLPEGMEHCTILFKECPKGHGRLTATNWVQHDCMICENERLVAELALFKAAVKAASEFDFGGFIRCVFCGRSFEHTQECIVRRCI